MTMHATLMLLTPFQFNRHARRSINALTINFVNNIKITCYTNYSIEFIIKRSFQWCKFYDI
jgi:hypothetical protein